MFLWRNKKSTNTFGLKKKNAIAGATVTGNQKPHKFLNYCCTFYYHIYPKYWYTLPCYYSCPKVWPSPFCYLQMCLNYCYMYEKHLRPWSDTTFCSFWSGSMLFAQASLSQYSGIMVIWVLKILKIIKNQQYSFTPKNVMWYKIG